MPDKIFITGASRGIGKALALQFARNGATVFITARNEKHLQTLAASIEKEGALCHYAVCDVSKKEDIFAAIEIANKKMGAIDIAIFNAGIGLSNYFSDFKTDTIRQMYDVNLFGVLYGLEKIIPIMKAQGKGTIVGVSSLADARGLTASAGYNSSKAALTQMLEAARVELGKENIKVITVRPGFVKTDMTDKNDFKMPFLMPVEKAVRIIYKGIKRKKSYIDFPFQLAFIAWIMTRLPNSIFEAISKKM